jgi:large subunit ribosomal protein L23
MSNSNAIILKPRLTEKTHGLSQNRVYVVDVAKDVNKHSVARAIETQFEVKVASVNITNIPGKAKRTISILGKRMSNSEGSRSDIKKAYVTLKEGHSLPFFDAVEEADEKETKLQEKIDKAATKQADKADKPARAGRLSLRRGKKDDTDAKAEEK